MTRITKRLGWFGTTSVLASVSILIVSFSANQLALEDPLELNVAARLNPPTIRHPFGTDELGRDILSRVIFGSRTSLLVAFSVVFASVALGGTIGITSGYHGRWLDEVAMRGTDIFFAFPQVILAMAVVVALGPGVFHVAIAVVLVWWPGYARLFRAQTLALKGMVYVEAARALGCSGGRIMFRHILPNSLGPITARMTMDVGYSVLYLAGLSFIGLGAQEPNPEWGLMIALSSKYALSHWWYPGLVGGVVTLTVMFFTLAGDALEDMVGK